MNGFGRRLILTQRQKPTRKWAIWYHVYDVIVVSILTSVRHILWKIGVFSKLFVMFCVFQTLQCSLLSLWISEVIYCRITLKKRLQEFFYSRFLFNFLVLHEKSRAAGHQFVSTSKATEGLTNVELIFYSKHFVCVPWFIVFSTLRFACGQIPESVNIPYNQAFLEEGGLAPSTAANTVISFKGRVIVVVGNRNNYPAKVGKRLLQCTAKYIICF